MVYEKFCNEIFRVDDDIRYVGIFYRTKSYTRMREGVKSLLTPEETRKSVEDAMLRWVSRRSLTKLGEPLYAMARYEKVKRCSVPLGGHGLVLVSMEPNADHDRIVNQVLKIRDKYLPQLEE